MFDSLVDSWSTTLDRAQRDQRMVEMARIYSEELPSTPIWYVLNLTVHTSALRGPGREADDVHLWELLR